MDGYYEINGDRIALEYLGCFWHGCDCRFNPSELNPVSKIPYGVLRRQTDNKLDVLRKSYNLKVLPCGIANGQRPNKTIRMS